MSRKQGDEKSEGERKMNRAELDGVPDLSQLVYLDMPNVLHNLKYRYCQMPRKHCYTSISSILLAINPYESLPIYGQDVIQEFHRAASQGRLVNGRPHPYGVSARAYMRMVQRKCNQSVIVCGQSGAGKTETTKLLMRYLAMTAPVSSNQPASASSSSIEEQIIAASPILEAYGNAKTVMNNNSSRFGKFTKLLYHVPPDSKQGNILGSSLETYLLEKSRVVFQAMNERNYHVFYFMHAGLGNNNKDYGLRSIDAFHYINQGQCFQPMKDVERFEELQNSLDMFRVNKDVQDVLWKLTSGVLNLGNISFKRKGDGYADIDSKSMPYVEMVSQLWGLPTDELIKRLVSKSLKVPGSKKDVIQHIQFDDAISNRDSIAKGIYENIFLWLCTRINAELLVEDDEDDDANPNADDAKTDEERGKYFIGILDVFGFENFYCNSLEQFCINMTNEKLQQYFNFHIIQSEQEEYLKESVFWEPLTIRDNEKYIQLVEHSKHGFFSLLDSACSAPGKNDTEAFMQILFKHHDKNPVLQRARAPGAGSWQGVKPKNSSGSKNRSKRGTKAKFEGFTIKHFADDVTYDVSHFLVKNIEAVHPDTNKMIKKSTVPIFKEINGVDGGARRRRKRTKKSVTAVFHKGIKTLMKNLNQTEPYFVRCINPNSQKSSKVWNEEIVGNQLRCGGLLEALRVLKLGYPTRVPYNTLYDTYHGAVNNPLMKSMSPMDFSTSLLIAFDVNEHDYELGLTKIFFKPAKAAVLDDIMSKAGQPLTPQQNAKITQYIVQRRCQQMIGAVKAFTSLRKLVRMKRAAKMWEQHGRVASLLGGTVMKHLYMARKQIRQRKEKHAAIMMQSFVRSCVQRKEFIRQAAQLKDATNTVWQSYRTMQKRHALQNWLDAKVERTRADREAKAAAQAAAQEAAAVEKATVMETKTQQVAGSEEVLNVETPSREEQLRIAREEAAAAAAKQRASVIVHEQEQKQTVTVTDVPKKPKQSPSPSPLPEPEAEAEAEAEPESEAKVSPEIAESKDNELSLREQIEARKREQEIVMYESTHEMRSDGSDDDRKAKKRKIIERNKRERARQDAKARKLRRAERLRKKYKQNPGDLTDYMSDSESEYEDNNNNSDDEQVHSEEDMEQQVSRFHKISAMGQLFYRHAGSRSRMKAQDRVIKVNFEYDGSPRDICWGGGSRHILFRDILYIAWGHWTPSFVAKKDALSEKRCFSVVGKEGQTLNLEGYNEHVTELWVRGLRKLIGQSNKNADSMAQKNLKNLMTAEANKKARKTRPDRRKLDDIMRLQQDLFIMSTHTVFRHLEEERIWHIDQYVLDRFSPQKMYQVALKEDIPWRTWQHWIREQVVTYLRENNGVIHTHTQTQMQMPVPVQQMVQPQVTNHPFVNVNNNNNNNNGHVANPNMMQYSYPLQHQPYQQPPYYTPAAVPVSATASTAAAAPHVHKGPVIPGQDEQCSLM